MARRIDHDVSVLFNESKLLKYGDLERLNRSVERFSTLQRVEIAEISIF